VALAEARGAAYTEFGINHMLEPRNVAETNMARLRQAELAAADGDVAARKAALASFVAVWPAATLPPPLRQRVAQLSGPATSSPPPD
jgi:hypothetical protein